MRSWPQWTFDSRWRQKFCNEHTRAHACTHTQTHTHTRKAGVLAWASISSNCPSVWCLYAWYQLCGDSAEEKKWLFVERRRRERVIQPVAAALSQCDRLDVSHSDHSFGLKRIGFVARKQDPPPPPPVWFEFLVIFFLLFAPLYTPEEVERHLLWKPHKTIQRKSWSNVPPKLLAYMISTQSCTQNWSSSKVQSRSAECNRLKYHHETWRTYSSCSWLQNIALGFFNFCPET